MKMSIRTLRARKNSAFQIDCLGGIFLTTLISECLKWGGNNAPHIRFCMWTINVKHCSTVNIHCRVERLDYIEACCILCLNWRKNINQSYSNHTITDWANRKTVSTKCSYRCTVRNRISLRISFPVPPDDQQGDTCVNSDYPAGQVQLVFTPDFCQQKRILQVLFL